VLFRSQVFPTQSSGGRDLRIQAVTRFVTDSAVDHGANGNQSSVVGQP
jgi:hypothetical protein